jgi:hypothetical protein
VLRWFGSARCGFLEALRLCQNQMAATAATTITIAITQRDLLLPFIVMSFSS